MTPIEEYEATLCGVKQTAEAAAVAAYWRTLLASSTQLGSAVAEAHAAGIWEEVSRLTLGSLLDCLTAERPAKAAAKAAKPRAPYRPLAECLPQVLAALGEDATTTDEVAAVTGIGRSRVYSALRALCDSGHVEALRQGRAMRWTRSRMDV